MRGKSQVEFIVALAVGSVDIPTLALLGFAWNRLKSRARPLPVVQVAPCFSLVAFFQTGMEIADALDGGRQLLAGRQWICDHGLGLVSEVVKWFLRE